MPNINLERNEWTEVPTTYGNFYTKTEGSFVYQRKATKPLPFESGEVISGKDELQFVKVESGVSLWVKAMGDSQIIAYDVMAATLTIVDPVNIDFINGSDRLESGVGGAAVNPTSGTLNLVEDEELYFKLLSLNAGSSYQVDYTVVGAQSTDAVFIIEQNSSGGTAITPSPRTIGTGTGSFTFTSVTASTAFSIGIDGGDPITEPLELSALTITDA